MPDTSQSSAPAPVPAQARIELPWVDPLYYHGAPPHIECHPFGGPLAEGFTAAAPRTRWAHLYRRLSPPGTPELPDDAVSILLSYNPDAPANERVRLAPMSMWQLGTPLIQPTDGMGFSERCPFRFPSAPNPSFDNREFRAFADKHQFRRSHFSVAPSSRECIGHGTKPNNKFFPYHDANATYCGFEFESEFGSRNSKVATLNDLWLLSDSLVHDPTARTGMPHQRRLYAETDSTLDGYSAEIITSPHAIRDPQTYYAMNKIFGTICRRAANTRGNCGMHMHLSRRYIHRISITLHDLFDGIMMSAIGWMVHNECMFTTGRPGLSDYASCRTGGRMLRFRAINWTSRPTLEFRFPGPGGFIDADWPNYMQDLILAIVDSAAHATLSFRATLSPETQGMIQGLAAGNGRSDRHDLTAFRNVCTFIRTFSDLYPYAFARFTSPHAPDAIKRIMQGN